MIATGALAGAEVLVTGATGAVGTEVVASLVRAGARVTGVSSRGRPVRSGSPEGAATDVADVPVVAWPMGTATAPHDVRRAWDVVVHTAASTRWTMTADEAWAANVSSTAALLELVGPDTPLVALSTAHVEGLGGSIASEDVADYRNTYEWSKAAAERLTRERHPTAQVLRFPIVLGRRDHGGIARFSGFYKLLSALLSGTVPAVVGVPHAYLDLVAVDDVSGAVADLATLGPGDATRPWVLGRGAEALRVEETLDLFFAAINEWREERDVGPAERPPLLDPERWERFYLPFSREHLSPLQQMTVELFSAFRPYLCLEEPFPTTRLVDPLPGTIRATIRRWADHRPMAASAVAEAWA